MTKRPDMIGNKWGSHPGNQFGLRHGHAIRHVLSPTYLSWQAMRQRIRDQKPGYEGITICQRWSEFGVFLKDMGERPEGLTLDRIDVRGNYEPDNCRWATRSEQRRNQHTLGHSTTKGQHWTVGADGKRIYSR